MTLCSLATLNSLMLFWPDIHLSMLGLPGGSEWIIIFVVVLLLFGGNKIPELLRGLGKGVGELQRGLEEGKKKLQEAIHEEDSH
jgi:sec-independent protein translocase protein TatA